MFVRFSFPGTPIGSVITEITANDVDSSPVLTYRFGNTSDPGPFSIDRYSGRVVLKKCLDAETRSEYVLQVIASDSIHEATTVLTVRVTDLNDNAPQFLQAAYVATVSGEFLKVLINKTVILKRRTITKNIHTRLINSSDKIIFGDIFQ